MQSREKCSKVLNGEVCPGTSHDDIDKMIRENDLVAVNIRGKNSDKLVVTTKDGTWKMTAITYNDSPDKMVLFKED